MYSSRALAWGHGRLSRPARSTCPTSGRKRPPKDDGQCCRAQIRHLHAVQRRADFPDPNGQGLIQINNVTGSLDASSPQFQKAETACNSLDNGFAEQLGATQASPESGSAQTST